MYISIHPCKAQVTEFATYIYITAIYISADFFNPHLHLQELDEMLSALTELRDIILESDISPFEMNYSGLIKALLNYLTTTDAPGNRYDRLRMFWKLFAESTVSRTLISLLVHFECVHIRNSYYTIPDATE